MWNLLDLEIFITKYLESTRFGDIYYQIFGIYQIWRYLLPNIWNLLDLEISITRFYESTRFGDIYCQIFGVNQIWRYILLDFWKEIKVKKNSEIMMFNVAACLGGRDWTWLLQSFSFQSRSGKTSFTKKNNNNNNNKHRNNCECCSVSLLIVR